MTRLSMYWAILIVMLCVMGNWNSRIHAEDAFLEATRPDFQKIPIWVMEFENVNSSQPLSLNNNHEVVDVLKTDLTRSQVFSVVDIPESQGDFSGNKCVGLSQNHEAAQQRVTVSTWGRIGMGGVDSTGKGLIFDACGYDAGNKDFLIGKRYFSVKATEPLLRLMTHRWADELVYRYTGEQGIARTKIAYVSEEGNGRELFVMDYDGYGPQQVTADGFLNLMPTWAPDRRSLVYTAYRKRNKKLSNGTWPPGKSNP